jgi:hypothetical protein
MRVSPLTTRNSRTLLQQHLVVNLVAAIASLVLLSFIRTDSRLSSILTNPFLYPRKLSVEKPSTMIASGVDPLHGTSPYLAVPSVEKFVTFCMIEHNFMDLLTSASALSRRIAGTLLVILDG